MERVWVRATGWGREILVWLGIVLSIVAGAQHGTAVHADDTAGSVVFSSPR